jgi:hypothetical protein
MRRQGHAFAQQGRVVPQQEQPDADAAHAEQRQQPPGGRPVHGAGAAEQQPALRQPQDHGLDQQATEHHGRR